MLACTAVFALLPLTSAAFPGTNGKIAFSTNRDGNYEIYTMEPDGGSQQRRTTDAAADTNPAFSADGAKIAFSRGGNIFTMNADGTGTSAMSLAAGDEPTWSPDGTKIAYVSSGDLFWIPAAGGTPNVLTSGAAADSSPAWSPNGAKIVFARDGEIYTIDSAGGGDQNLTQSASTESQPNWSPDGGKIVYISTASDPSGDVWTMDSSNGANQTRLTPTNGLAEAWPTWSPDGTAIAFTRSNDIYSIGVGGGASAQLTTDINVDQQPDWGAIPAAPTSPPVNTSSPTISGTPAVGSTLTGSNGGWTGNPTPTFTYQWKRCDSAGNNCVDISGATSINYTVTSTDVGSTLKLEVKAQNSAGGPVTATSNATAPVTSTSAVPANITRPTITGTPTVGVALSATAGTWTNTPTSFTYQWKKCDAAGTNCANIAGAITASYTPVAADVGARLVVSVLASNSAGSSAAAVESLPSTAVAATAALANTVRPVITGTPAVGQVLTTTDGTWTGTPTSFTYQWRRCDATSGSCTNIAAATNRTYTVVAADNGFKLMVVVTANNASGTPVAASSDQTAAVGSGNVGPAVRPVNTTLPAVSGQAATGQTLRASNGNWTGTTPMTFAYQWQACDAKVVSCTSVQGATQSTYAVTAKDRGKRIRVRVTATNSAGSAAAASQATALIGVKPVAKKAGRKLVGTARNDKLTGTARNDTLDGRGGNDRLNGLGGNDRLLGGTGNDLLFGGAGVDNLNGGRGKDLFSGGAGNDAFSARDRTIDIIDCGAGRDRVTADRIDIIRKNCETVKRSR